MVAFSDLVVVIPGILGSRLVRRDGNRTKVVWDLSIRNLPRLLWAAATGALLFHEDDETIKADSLFSYQLLPGFFGVDDYVSLVGVLRGVASADQVVTLPYDWRRSNRIAADALAMTVGDGLRKLREAGAKDPKAWLVAHSMGGLVARYYCEHLGGAADTRGIISIGTPHRGSMAALDALVNGKKYGPLDLTPFVRSMPAIYELLPLFPMLRTGSGKDLRLLRIAETFGLDPVTGEDLPEPADGDRPPPPDPVPHLNRAMLQDALRFHAAIRVPAESRPPADTGYLQRVIFNRRQHTLHSASALGSGLEMFLSYPVLEGQMWREDDARGDGTVPAQSAVPIEWDNTGDAVPNAQKHTAIQATREAHDTISNWLRPADARGFRGREVSDDDVIVLDLAPVIGQGEPLEVTVSAGRGTFATVEVTNESTGQTISQPVAVTDEPRTLTFGELPAGVQKVTARARAVTHPPVSDYTYVIGPEG
jgi:pimeloyl-ACP methyl ester carboxylesterase